MNDELMDKNETTTTLFVYGTLMPNEANHGHIQDFVRAARRGTVEGVLVDLGRYPALVHGRGIVRGVLLEVDEEALAITDRIEGYAPNRSCCLYLREKVTVRLENGHEKRAWTYVFADPQGAADRVPLIVSEIEGTPVFAWRGKELFT